MEPDVGIDAMEILAIVLWMVAIGLGLVILVTVGPWILAGLIHLVKWPLVLIAKAAGAVVGLCEGCWWSVVMAANRKKAKLKGRNQNDESRRTKIG